MLPKALRVAKRAAGRGRRAVQRWRNTRWRGPLLSIVVPVYDVERYLDECLTSLRRQHYRSVEIIVVDDGSPDRSIDIARRHARHDRRVKIVQRENGGLSAARNTGIDAARGEFVTFVDSDDYVLLGGYAAAVASLEDTGSDFAMLPYERLRGGVRQRPTWIAELYSRPRAHVTIATDPDLLSQAPAWSKVYRKTFWERAGLRFPEGLLIEDQEVTAAAHAAATGVDIVDEPNYVYRHRPRSIMREFSAGLMHRFFDAVHTSLDVLDAVPGARRDRARQVLSNDMPHFLRNLPRVGDLGFEQAFCERLPDLLAEVEPSALQDQCPAEMRVAFELIRQGRIDDLHHFLNHDGLDLSAHESTPESAGPSIHVPFWGDDRIDPATFVLSDRQTVLDTRVLRARLSETGVDLVVWAYLRHLDAHEGPTATFRWVDVAGRPVADLTAERAGETVGHHLRTVRESNERAAFRVRGDWPSHDGPLRLEATVTHLGRTRTGVVTERDAESSAAVAQSAGGWALDPEGPFRLVRRRRTSPPAAGSVTVTDIRADESGVHLSVSGAPERIELASSRVCLDGVADGDDWLIRLEAPVFDRGTFPAPIGDYRVRAVVGGEPVSVGFARDVLLRLPETFRLERTRGRLVLDGERVVVRIDKPRTDLEQSVWGQRRLRAAYQRAEADVQPGSALLQCYGAEVATDTPLALHTEIRRRGLDWTLWWGVVDHAVPVPEGATPLIAGSQAWYDAMARAQYLIKNIEMPAYLVKRPGQVHVQTFHGQPFKSMGRALWGGQRGWPEWRVKYEIAERRSDRWDLIVSPHAEGTRHYREQFDYEGPAFELGMPRVDSLSAPDAEQVRARVRDVLGIGDRIAVLYAATWRDDRAAGPMGARDVDHLDVAALARELGDDYVILQRSHGSVARTDRRHGDRAGVIDVTDYPEINELTLASDVAVLDYSSLRFDYAVTGKPMVFFVPDLDEYSGATRGFLFSYEGTAPGPWVTSQAELVERLRDRAWTVDQTEQYAVFNDRFNLHHDGHSAARLIDRLLE